jgi:hypothetical protein
VSAAALLFATARAAEGGPAAMLALDGSMLVARLLDQLERLGVRRAWVLTRPQWADSVRGAVEGGALDAHVMDSHDLAEDLRTAAAVAGRAGGPLLLGSADVLVHGAALALVLENPRAR